jgi:hypothetical protein
MELLIPGLILVGLMVYASTRIKRSAARAFEEETIGTSDFTLKKPDELLQVLNGDPSLSFEAYSREFGAIGHKEVRAVTASVRISEEQPARDGEVLSELNEVIGDQHYSVIESKEIDDGGEFRVIRKVADRGSDIIILEVRALEPVSDAHSRRIDVMIQSFTATGASQ